MEKDQQGEETVEVAAAFTLLFAYENGGIRKTGYEQSIKNLSDKNAEPSVLTKPPR